MSYAEINGQPCGAKQPLLWILGPCVIESEEMTLRIAKEIYDIAGRIGKKYDWPFFSNIVFKASFDKANRTSLSSFRGVGTHKGLGVLEKVRKVVGFRTTTDIHDWTQAEPVSRIVDLLQIPAFLCRQTDLLQEAAKQGKAVNIKKGQFVSPKEMGYAVVKCREMGNNNIFLTERGTFFGYNNLVNDMRSIPEMQKHGTPVIYDATHSNQKPGGGGPAPFYEGGSYSGGSTEHTLKLARAAVAAGCDGIFAEVHPNPEESPSDSATILPLSQLEKLMDDCTRIKKVYEQCQNGSSASRLQ